MTELKSHTTARIVADTVNPHYRSARITTFEVNAPRYLLAEINTHRVVAKSAASSRAIPVERRIQMVLNEPYVPLSFGKNKKGMQAEELADNQDEATKVWLASRDDAVKHAEALKKLGIHKQQANRILEPYTYVKVCLTATETDNLFKLRIHPDADPGFFELASKMKAALDASTPSPFHYHLPWVSPEECADLTIKQAFKISAARCARVSYKTFDGALSTIDKDLQLCEELIAAGHMSPFDHPATGDHTVTGDDGMKYWAEPLDHRHFWGWKPMRVKLETKGRRDSFSALPPL